MSDAKANTMYQGDENLTAYFRQIRHLPLLTFADELELSRRIKKGDDVAGKTLVEGNLRLVVKIARQFLSGDIQLVDLIQEGNIGLLPINVVRFACPSKPTNKQKPDLSVGLQLEVAGIEPAS